MRTATPTQAGTSTAVPDELARTTALVPETVPFISDRDRASIRSGDYLPAMDHKAIAISANRTGIITGQPDDDTAKTAALDACKRATEASGSKNPCQLYAVGNDVVFNVRPPMPPQPWLLRNPAVERLFAGTDMPLVRDTARTYWDKNYPKESKPKALALSSGGYAFDYHGVGSTDEAMRRALKSCGYGSGIPCIIVAVDDNFVVPIPTTMHATGLFHINGNAQIAPELRDSVSRRLSGRPMPGTPSRSARAARPE